MRLWGPAFLARPELQPLAETGVQSPQAMLSESFILTEPTEHKALVDALTLSGLSGVGVQTQASIPQSGRCPKH